MNIFMMGDIHGNFKDIRRFNLYCKDNNISDPCLILLGDSGLNYYLDERDERFKRRVNKYGFPIFVIRGNHDARPSTLPNFHITNFFGGPAYQEPEYPNIYYALDKVSIYNILGHKTLVVPGAYSVDKYIRLSQGYSWFEDEQLNEKEIAEAWELIYHNKNHFDMVLSHTCPVQYEPTFLFSPLVDQSLVDKTMERFLGQVDHEIDYKLWCWGHYHDTLIYPNEDGQQRLMLYNKKILCFNKYVKTNNVNDSIYDLYE